MSLTSLLELTAGKNRSPATIDESSQPSGQHSTIDCVSPQPESQRVTENDNIQSGRLRLQSINCFYESQVNVNFTFLSIL